MQTYTLKFPDTLFVSTTLITKMDIVDNEVVFHGESVPDVVHPSHEGWESHGFGFITSNVSSESIFDKVHHLYQMVDYAQRKRERIEFVVNIVSGTLGIFWRKQKSNF